MQIQRKKSISIRAVLIVLLIFSTALATFGTGQQEVTPTKKTSVKLVAMFSSGGSGRTLTASAMKFQEETGIYVKVLTFPWNELNEKQVLALSQGSPTPDVIAVDTTWLPQMQNFLDPIPLGSTEKNRFVASMLKAFEWPRGSGQYRALPVRMGGDVIMYRADVFESNGIDPNSIYTWEDILKIAKKITNPDKKQFGWAQGYTPYGYLVTQWTNLMSSYGVQVLSNDGKKALFNTSNGIKGTETLIELAREAAPPGVINYGYNEQVEAMQTGLVVMGMVWNPRYTLINKKDFPYSGKWRVLPRFPYGEGSGLSQGVPRVYGWGLGINKFSENKEAVERLIKFVSSEKEQLRLAVNFNNSPTVKSVFKNQEYQKAVPESVAMQKALANGIGRPVHPKWTQIEDTIGLQLQRAIEGEITASEAIADAEIKVNNILSK